MLSAIKSWLVPAVAILLFLLGRDRRRDGAIYTRLMRQPQTSI